MARWIVLLAGAPAALMLMGAEAPSVVAKAFGNTIVSTYPDGRTGELWIKPDGDYTAKGRRGDPSSGRWRVNVGKLCLKQSKPIPAPFSYCTAIPAGGMDKAWSAKAVTGEAIQVKLLKGRHTGGV